MTTENDQKTVGSAGGQTQITLTLLDDRNIESVSVHPSLRAAVAHGEEMLAQGGLGWIAYHAVGEGKEISKVSRRSIK